MSFSVDHLLCHLALKKAFKFWSGIIHSYSKTLWCLIISPIWKKEPAAPLNPKISFFEKSFALKCLAQLLSLDILMTTRPQEFFFFVFFSTDASCQRSQGEFSTDCNYLLLLHPSFYLALLPQNCIFFLCLCLQVPKDNIMKFKSFLKQI